MSNRIEFLLENQRGIQSLFFDTISGVCRRFSNPAESNDRMSEQRSLLLSLGARPPPQHTGKQKNHRHHDRHDPPASNGSNFRGMCDRRTSRNQLRWFLCGDLIFIEYNSLIPYFIHYYSMCIGWASRGTKGEFLMLFHRAFFAPMVWYDAHWPKLFADTFFSVTPPVLILF